MEDPDFERNAAGVSARGNIFLIVVMNLTIFFLLPLMTGVGIVLFLPSLVIFKMVTGWDSGRVMRLFVWIYGNGWLGITAPFTRFRKEGFQEAGVRPPCIMVVNHYSFFDTFFLGALPFSDVTFAVRAWPFKMFWYTPFMRLAGYLDVESMEWEATLEACKKVIKTGGALIFFPEAHRSRDGRLGRFYSGAFKVAVSTGMPVVPLCIAGSGRFFPPDRFWIEPAHVRLKALPAVYPGAFSGVSAHIEMRKAIKRLMAENLAEMMKDQRTGTSSAAKTLKIQKPENRRNG